MKLKSNYFIGAILWIASAILLALFLIEVSHAKSIDTGWTQQGVGSYYASKFNGRKTASGERYRHQALTAAHRTLPFGTKIQVMDKDTGKAVVVTVNDRGPFHKGRILDLSGKAAKELGITKKGVCDVELTVLSLPTKGDTKPLTSIPSLNDLPKTKSVFKDRSDSIANLIAVNFDISKL